MTVLSKGEIDVARPLLTVLKKLNPDDLLIPLIIDLFDTLDARDREIAELEKQIEHEEETTG